MTAVYGRRASSAAPAAADTCAEAGGEFTLEQAVQHALFLGMKSGELAQQEVTSMVPGRCSRPSRTIGCSICAPRPGSKTSQVLDMMGPDATGLLIVNERDTARMRRLAEAHAAPAVRTRPRACGDAQNAGAACPRPRRARWQLALSRAQIRPGPRRRALLGRRHLPQAGGCVRSLKASSCTSPCTAQLDPAPPVSQGIGRLPRLVYMLAPGSHRE